MALQRYSPGDYRMEPPIEDDNGDFVKFKDVIELLEDISKFDPDISPKLAALKAGVAAVGK